MQKVAILGSTGSVGASSLTVLRQHSAMYEVYALSAFRQLDKLAALCAEFHPKIVVVPDVKARQLIRNNIAADIQVYIGEEGLNQAAIEADILIAAIVGSAGFSSTLAAAAAGKKILLANKESLVMAGNLLIAVSRESGAMIIPIDSEHNAIFQCLPANYQNPQIAGVNKIILTASGGPFLHRNNLADVTIEDACAHPNWQMGRKISVDSATMMNKGLELIEASYLFQCDYQQIEVVIHPQSIVHSLVEYIDGSILAQLSNPDMCIPIAHALAYPQRIQTDVKPLNLYDLCGLEFIAPDEKRFRCLFLAKQALRQGTSALIYLNAANEVAVNAFLLGEISFLDIIKVIENVLQQTPTEIHNSLENIMQLDNLARDLAREMINRC